MLTFAEDWSFTTGELLDGEIWWPAPEPAGTVAARGITSGPDEDIGNIENVLATAVAQARQRLRIVTPYFLPDDRLLSGIVLAAERGVEVEVILPQQSDHLLLDWAMAAHVSFLDMPGISFHQTGQPFDHAKLVTVDGQWCAIGSPNWDVRSLRLNFEFLLEGYDQGLAQDIDRLIDAKRARARPLSPKRLMRRPIPIRLRDAAARLLLPYL
jgi:cardiolipin synthase